MTIRSIDMQVLIPKVNDIARIQNTQQQENLSRQQELVNQNTQQTFKNTATVNQPLRDEAALIHDKQEQEAKKKSKKHKEKKGNGGSIENTENSSEPTIIEAGRGTNIDIKI